MGLDISVYKNVKKAKQEDADELDIFLCHVAHNNWLHKIKNLENQQYYSGEYVKNVGVSYPYSSHFRFRMFLLDVIGRDDLVCWKKREIFWDKLTDDLPFIYLIDFSDCEGAMDWECAEVLYKEFEQFRDKALINGDQYEYQSYLKWLNVFKAAVENKGLFVLDKNIL